MEGFFEVVVLPTLFIILVAMGLVFGFGAMMDGTYRDIIPLTDGCYIVQESEIEWYHPWDQPIYYQEKVCD